MPNPKIKRLYGLFEKQGDTWVRVPNTGAYQKSIAVRIFQSALLSFAFGGPERCLKVVRS